MSLRWDKPTLSGAELSWRSRFAFNGALLLLGVSAALACFCAVFRPPVYGWVVVPFVLVLTLAATALFMGLRPRAGALVALVTLLSAEALIAVLAPPAFIGNHAKPSFLLQGALRMTNVVFTTYNQRTTFNFVPLLVAPADAAIFRLSLTVFLLAALTPTIILAAWLLIQRKSVFGCIALTLLFLMPGFWCTLIPPFTVILPLLLFWLFLLIYIAPLRRASAFRQKWRRRRERNQPRQKRYLFRDEGAAAQHPRALLLLIPLALCLLLTAFLFPEARYQRGATVNNLYWSFFDGRIGRAFFLTNSGIGSTKRVDLRSVSDIRFSGQTALLARTGSTKPDYLKGFVGSRYTETGWELLDKTQHAELYSLATTYSPQNYPSLDASLSDDPRWLVDHYTIDIKVVNSNPRMVYSPYGLSSTPQESLDTEFVDDAFLRSADHILGLGEYELSACRVEFNKADLYLIDGMRLVADDNARVFISEDKSYFSYSSDAQGFAYSNYSEDGSPLSFQVIPPTEQLPATTDEEAAFREAARRYGAFAQKTYTQLPPELKKTLARYREERELLPENYASTEDFIVACVAQVQKENGYTLSPGTTPQGQDFVEYFLLKNHKGYCVHFASALTALLRSADIPARYAEGFLVSPYDKKNSDGWIVVPDSRSHAWAEVYEDGYGWRPVEATPAGANRGRGDPSEAGALAVPWAGEEAGGRGNTAGGQNASGQGAAQSHEATKTPGAAASRGATSTATTAAAAGATHAGKQTLLVRALFVAAALLVASALLVAARRRARLAARGRRFRQPDAGAAICAAYDYLLQLEAFRQREAPPGIPAEITEIALRARYSQHPPDPGERTQVLACAQKLAREIRENSPFPQRALGAWYHTLF
ncbi:MAG: transglutaminase-like domain-containing protein [Actinomycetia bacterium]|nr:transglutaminase-like domain-containing protein [Actinomycetes bacterium]